MVVLFLIFWGLSIWFSVTAEPIYISAKNVQVLKASFSHLQNAMSQTTFHFQSLSPYDDTWVS